MNRSLIIILVAGLLVRLFLFFYFLDEPAFFWDDDSNTYIYTAENMLAGNGFSWDTHPPYIPDAFRTPGYPIFLLLHIVLFGSYYVAWSWDCFFYFFAGQRIWESQNGLLGGGCFSCHAFLYYG